MIYQSVFVPPWNAIAAMLVLPSETKETEMTTRAAGGILLTILIASVSSVASRAADEIKGGKWQFTTQMQLPGTAQSPPGVQASAGGNAPRTSTACIDAANPIPPQGQCKLDQVDRHASVVTWAMTCNTTRGPIQSAGSGRYAGDTMEATLTARVRVPTASRSILQAVSPVAISPLATQNSGVPPRRQLMPQTGCHAPARCRGWCNPAETPWQ